MLDQITPLVLTYNEAPNIARTLRQLRWARDVVLVDSCSEDETREIAASFPNVRVFQRKFDDHAAQWNFGLKQTGIETGWVLALDADYVLTPELVDELDSLEPVAGTAGYQAAFTYCIEGRALRSGVYPPVTVLYRRPLGDYAQDGHTHRLVLKGSDQLSAIGSGPRTEVEIERLRARILHDDRKSLGRWFAVQQRYMALEAKKIISSDAGSLSMADRIRRMRVVAPFAVMLHCVFIRGGILDGWPGLYYAFQRTVAELMLSLYLIEHDLNLLSQREMTPAKTNGAEEGRQKAAAGRH